MELPQNSYVIDSTEDVYVDFWLPEQPFPGKLMKEVAVCYPNLKERIAALQFRFKNEYEDYIANAENWYKIAKIYLNGVVSLLNKKNLYQKLITIDLDNVDFQNCYFYNLKDTLEIVMLDGNTYKFTTEEFTEFGIKTLNVARECFYYINTINQEKRYVTNQIQEWSFALGADQNENSNPQLSKPILEEQGTIPDGVTLVSNEFRGKLPGIQSAFELYNTKKIKYDGSLGELGIFLKALEKRGFPIGILRKLKYSYFYKDEYKFTNYITAKNQASRGAKRVAPHLKRMT